MKHTGIHIIALALALLAGWAQTPACAYESTKAERNYIKDGNKAFKDGNYAKALQYYTYALDAAAGSERAMFNQAVALTHLTDPADTTSANLQRAKEIYSRLGEHAQDVSVREKANYNLGNIAFGEQDYKQSIDYYKKVLRSNPGNTRARQNLRIAQLKLPPEDQQQQDQQQQQQDQQDQQQDQQQQQQQQQQQEQEMSGNAQQILQTMQNRENQTREKAKKEEVNAATRSTDKPW